MEHFFNIYGDEDIRPPKGQVIIGITDHEGNWPERTKQSHPYSYDPICQYMDKSVEANGTVYHDRMQQWDYKKFDRVLKEHCRDGCYSFNNSSTVQKVLRSYFEDDTIELACIIEYCNVSSGYPCWRFDYKSSKEAA